MKPKSEIRTTGKRFFPIAIGMFFAFVSGLAIYGTASAVRFYADYGDLSSLLVSLAMLLFMFGLIVTATITVHRSEWGYKLRSFVVLMIIFATATGFAAVLMQGPVERFADKLGLTNRLRAEDRLLGESTVYGRISKVGKDSIEIDLMGGGLIKVSLDASTRVFPMGTELKNSQVVGVILRSDSKVAKWVRVLPPNHPAGRKVVSGFFETRLLIDS
jgi:preprotein translocase subunit YajC